MKNLQEHNSSPPPGKPWFGPAGVLCPAATYRSPDAPPCNTEMQYSNPVTRTAYPYDRPVICPMCGYKGAKRMWSKEDE